MKLKAACVQLNTSNDIKSNIESAKNFINQASKDGAQLVALPENASFMSKSYNELQENSYYNHEHPALQEFRDIAEKCRIWLLVGSLAIKVKGESKLANRSFLINDNGEIAAFYDKIHLFDSSTKGGETHRESDRFIAGNNIVTTDTPWGKVGLTICYDVRFPYLYRNIAQQNTNIIFVPSSFTHFTGKAHWHILLRARAIENGCYIIAPAQTGTHPSSIKTYGHSLIINPWGEILADAGDKPCIISAEIDTRQVADIRAQIPSLTAGNEMLSIN